MIYAAKFRFDRGLTNLGKVTPTLIANDRGGCEDLSHGVLIIEIDETSNSVGGVGREESNNGTQWFQQDRIYDPKGVAPALMKDKSDLLIVIDVEDKKRNE